MTPEWIENYKNEFETVLCKKLRVLDGATEPVASAVRYALNGAGKRLRPVLAMLGAEFAKADRQAAFHIALAIECVHNYSLVHDDLPCMDNDTLRHGKPCTHVAFGEGMGVLAGDALLNLAFEWLTDAAPHAQNFAAMGYFARQSGVFGMIGGQCLDIREQSFSAEGADEKLELYRLKTSCLFRAAAVGAAIACGADQKECGALEYFCDCLGMIFQIVDDILDYTSSEEELGKNVMSDRDSGKKTYVDEVGTECALCKIAALEASAEARLRPYGARAERLIELMKALSCRKK